MLSQPAIALKPIIGKKYSVAAGAATFNGKHYFRYQSGAVACYDSSFNSYPTTREFDHEYCEDLFVYNNHLIVRVFDGIYAYTRDGIAWNELRVPLALHSRAADRQPLVWDNHGIGQLVFINDRLTVNRVYPSFNQHYGDATSFAVINDTLHYTTLQTYSVIHRSLLDGSTRTSIVTNGDVWSMRVLTDINNNLTAHDGYKLHRYNGGVGNSSWSLLPIVANNQELHEVKSYAQASDDTQAMYFFSAKQRLFTLRKGDSAITHVPLTNELAVKASTVTSLGTGVFISSTMNADTWIHDSKVDSIPISDFKVSALTNFKSLLLDTSIVMLGYKSLKYDPVISTARHEAYAFKGDSTWKPLGDVQPFKVGYLSINAYNTMATGTILVTTDRGTLRRSVDDTTFTIVNGMQGVPQSCIANDGVLFTNSRVFLRCADDGTTWDTIWNTTFINGAGTYFGIIHDVVCHVSGSGVVYAPLEDFDGADTIHPSEFRRTTADTGYFSSITFAGIDGHRVVTLLPSIVTLKGTNMYDINALRVFRLDVITGNVDSVDVQLSDPVYGYAVSFMQHDTIHCIYTTASRGISIAPDGRATTWALPASIANMPNAWRRYDRNAGIALINEQLGAELSVGVVHDTATDVSSPSTSESTVPVMLYPNPANTSVTMDFSGVTGEYIPRTIVICDMLGTVVRTIDNSSLSTVLAISTRDFEAASYLIRYQINAVSYTSTLIISR